MRTRSKIIVTLCIAYAISWVIPISFLENGDLIGYEGAKLANENLAEGLQFFFSNEAQAAISIENIIGNISRILMGLPNILFIIAAIFAFLGKDHALYFIAPGVVIMFMWGTFGIIIFIGGYGLWLLSGIGLFLVSAISYKKNKKLKFTGLLSSPPLLIAIFVGSILLLWMATPKAT